MPSPPPTSNKHQDREIAKQRVVRVFREGGDWCTAAIHNDLSYSTARHAIMSDGADPKKRGRVRPLRVKMTVAVMAALEDLVNEAARMSLHDMRDHLRSALASLLKQLQIKKASMNNSTNKAKRKAFVERLNEHVEQGDVIVFQHETNFNDKNLHVQDGVSSGTGVVLLKTQGCSIGMQENARFIVNIFVAALRTEEFRQLEPMNKVIIVADNTPAHSRIEELAREQPAADGIMNGGRLVILLLAPCGSMLNLIEDCWSVLKVYMRRYVAGKKEEFLVRGGFATFTEHRLFLMKEAVAVCAPMITQRLVQRMKRHYLRAC